MKNYLLIFIVSLFFLSITHSIANEQTNTHQVHVMREGDTLWDLSNLYFNNPYLWRNITEIDGSSIHDIYRIPVGHKVLIYQSLKQEVNSVHLGDDSVISQNLLSRSNKKSRKKTIKAGQNQYLYLTKSTGLIRAFWNGQYVTIPIKTIAKYVKTKSTILNVDEVIISKGVYIDKELIKQLLGIKE